MRPLFLCNTHYQIIVAIQMRLTLFKSDDAGICITNHSVGAEQVAAQIMALGLFTDVFYWPNRNELEGPLGINKVKKLISVGLAPKKSGRFGAYDALIFFNNSYAVYEIANELEMYNSLKIYRMEEGLSSCSNGACHSWRSSRLAWAIGGIRNLLKKPSLPQACKVFYCFIPELCETDFPLRPIRIPSPVENRSELTNVLKAVYDFKGFIHPQKYIFFASSTDIDGRPTGETELVLALARTVGAENLIVKMHPRDRRTIYKDAGIDVMEDSYIPWEVIQLCDDLSNRMLLTCSSGSPLAITALINDDTEGFYLQPIMRTAKQRTNYEAVIAPVCSTLTKLQNLGLCNTIRFSSLDNLDNRSEK